MLHLELELSLFIRKMKHRFSVKCLCVVFNVSTSGYYDWFDRPMSQRDKDDLRLTIKLYCFHADSKHIYGSPKPHKDLLDDGEEVGIKHVERLMIEAGIQAKTTKKFVVPSNSKHSHQVASNLLERRFNSNKKDIVWVTDTTFIHTKEGWLYILQRLWIYIHV